MMTEVRARAGWGMEAPPSKSSLLTLSAQKGLLEYHNHHRLLNFSPFAPTTLKPLSLPPLSKPPTTTTKEEEEEGCRDSDEEGRILYAPKRELVSISMPRHANIHLKGSIHPKALEEYGWKIMNTLPSSSTSSSYSSHQCQYALAFEGLMKESTRKEKLDEYNKEIKEKKELSIADSYVLDQVLLENRPIQSPSDVEFTIQFFGTELQYNSLCLRMGRHRLICVKKVIEQQQTCEKLLCFKCLFKQTNDLRFDVRLFYNNN